MDDICDSVRTEKEATELTRSFDRVLETGGFKVKGWLSSKVWKKPKIDQETSKGATILRIPGINQEKVLGVAWNSDTNVFTFKVKPELTLQPGQLTKRLILNHVAQIYGPIGFASAFLIRAKIALQDLWIKGTDSGEEFPSDTQVKWTNLF